MNPPHYSCRPRSHAAFAPSYLPMPSAHSPKIKRPNPASRYSHDLTPPPATRGQPWRKPPPNVQREEAIRELA